MSHQSHTTHSNPRWTLALASALLVAGLGAPTVGSAQAFAPERTPSNRLAIPSANATPAAAPTVPTAAGIPGSVDGTRALLGRRPSCELDDPDGRSARLPSPTDAPVDGERVLLEQ
jgi:hypothetical protein